MQTTNYKKEFEVFSTNANIAARALHYSVSINKQVTDEKVLDAINEHPRFWLDYRYFCIQSLFIALGRIFDTDTRSHSIDRLLAAIKKTDFFTIESFKKREMASSNDKWREKRIAEAHEFGAKDHAAIEALVKDAKNIWNGLKGVRDKIFAHEDILDDTDKLAIMKTGQYDQLILLVQKLLTLEHILEQAELNARKPDFSFQDQRVKEMVEKMVSAILSKLASAKNSA